MQIIIMRRIRQSVIVGAFLIGVVLGQTVLDPTLVRPLCNSQPNCRACILANPSCVWCADQNYNGTRCYANDDPDFASACSQAGAQIPTGEVQSTEGPPLGGLVQVSPSTINLRVRPGTPQTFPFRVRPANNFPIDIYLLMDLSFSMEDDLANLKALGADLANAIVTLSTNFSIGFGSFVEKVVGPYTSLNPLRQQDPCNDNCVPTYSYRHVISLTNDSVRFNNLVQDQAISGNQDLPEGGFDGFLQALICTDLIGWREVSRRLLLYITDAGFHFAGDGKLGGIILPHQRVCRVPSQNGDNPVDLPDTDLYDYPSVGQIAQALREQNIIPIFAAQEDVMDFYTALVSELGDGASAGTLEEDSGNVVDLVREEYNTISQRVLFDQERVPGVAITVRNTNCPGGFVENGICNGLQIEETANFEASVSITECTPAIAAGVNVPVRVVGFGTLNVFVQGVCECPCDMNTAVNSPVCNSNGNLTCGQCECNMGFFGAFCQCNASNQQTLECPQVDGMECSGQGSCVCGQCMCTEGFFGPACECVTEDCVFDGQVCSGRGECQCNGQCVCDLETVTNEPYRGEGDINRCQCTPDQTNCIDPSNSTNLCNDRGTCNCDGVCECNDPYSGTFCEVCDANSEVCLVSNCDSNIDCANCILDLVAPAADSIETSVFFSRAMMNQSISELPMGYIWSRNPDDNGESELITLPMSQCSQCPNGAVIVNGTESTDYRIDGEMTVNCPLQRDGCNYRYFVGVDMATDEFTAVHVTYNRTCAQTGFGTAPWIIAISILIPLLVLGFLLLLLLKLLLLLLDYVEVRKFERDIKNTKYSKNENPLYRSAAKDYQNPLYGQ